MSLHSQPLTTAPRDNYRSDIDGLRGIAVLAVVGYHAFPHLLPGGFVGVDIFFVISGFLISTILFNSISNNSFSLFDFYSRRVRRIFPALLVIFIFCYWLGWFVLLPHEFQQLGKHIASGASFISNFVFWSEAGYFDNTAITKPLLHLWSLAIEEQFYILWPFVIWVGYKFRVSWWWIIIAVGSLSFLLNLRTVYGDLTAAFYSPFTRIWELLLGALVALFSKPWWFNHQGKPANRYFTETVSFLSWGTLAFSFSISHQGTLFPGAWALLPTVSTAALIGCCRHTWVSQKILSNQFLVWFGLISFPLYLWHWPLLSFARIIEGQPLTLSACLMIVALSISFAWLTYSLIEKPIRFGSHRSFKAIALCGLLLVVGVVGFNAYIRNGLDFRGPQVVGKDRGYDGGPGGTLVRSCGLPDDIAAGFTCWSDTRPTLKFALVGDSKAGAIHGGLVRTSTEAGRWLFIGVGNQSAPLPILTKNPLYAKYQYGSETAIKALADNKQIEVVLIATATRALFQLKNDTDIEDLETSQNYQVALDGLQNVIDVLKQGKKKVVVLIDNPTLPHPEDCLPRTTSSSLLNRLLGHTLNQHCRLPVDRHLELSRKYRQLLTTLETHNTGTVSLFDTMPFVCDLGSNLCATTKNGRLMYNGTDHISDHAAGLVGQELNVFLAKLKAKE